MTSANLKSNWGSRLNLKVSTRCGCSPYFCQMRCTVAAESPSPLASRRALRGWRPGFAQRRADGCPLLGRTDAPRAAGPCLGARAIECRATVAPPPDRDGWAKLPTAAPSVARPRRRRWPGSPWPAGQILRHRRRSQPRFQHLPIRFRHRECRHHAGQLSIFDSLLQLVDITLAGPAAPHS